MSNFLKVFFNMKLFAGYFDLSLLFYKQLAIGFRITCILKKENTKKNFPTIGRLSV